MFSNLYTSSMGEYEAIFMYPYSTIRSVMLVHIGLKYSIKYFARIIF